MTVTIMGPVTDFYINCFYCSIRLRYNIPDVKIRTVFSVSNDRIEVKVREHCIVCPSCNKPIRVGQ